MMRIGGQELHRTSSLEDVGKAIKSELFGRFSGSQHAQAQYSMGNHIGDRTPTHESGAQFFSAPQPNVEGNGKKPQTPEATPGARSGSPLQGLGNAMEQAHLGGRDALGQLGRLAGNTVFGHWNSFKELRNIHAATTQGGSGIENPLVQTGIKMARRHLLPRDVMNLGAGLLPDKLLGNAKPKLDYNQLQQQAGFPATQAPTHLFGGGSNYKQAANAQFNEIYSQAAAGVRQPQYSGSTTPPPQQFGQPQQFASGFQAQQHSANNVVQDLMNQQRMANEQASQRMQAAPQENTYQPQTTPMSDFQRARQEGNSYIQNLQNEMRQGMNAETQPSVATPHPGMTQTQAPVSDYQQAKMDAQNQIRQMQDQIRNGQAGGAATSRPVPPPPTMQQGAPTERMTSNNPVQQARQNAMNVVEQQRAKLLEQMEGRPAQPRRGSAEMASALFGHLQQFRSEADQAMQRPATPSSEFDESEEALYQSDASHLTPATPQPTRMTAGDLMNQRRMNPITQRADTPVDLAANGRVGGMTPPPAPAGRPAPQQPMAQPAQVNNADMMNMHYLNLMRMQQAQFMNNQLNATISHMGRNSPGLDTPNIDYDNGGYGVSASSGDMHSGSNYMDGYNEGLMDGQQMS
ncbi:hypothetical protein ACKC9G_11565 [Pokkaliibacter sp. CJK22405]|uniref:hypothetical protein n=1 Tax=Pokkaliibacter sp. CJK22405 TaxID=3384615 RepID=UPI003984BEEE